jgi:DNA-binding response OmpR family regulator
VRKVVLGALQIQYDSEDTQIFHRACKKAKVPFVCQSVADGEEAIACLSGKGTYSDRKKYRLPSLVLLELTLPRKSGFEVLTWIRSRPELKYLPVIVLSASKRESDMKKAYDLGASSYLVKPRSFDEVVKLVQTIHRYWLKVIARDRPGLPRGHSAEKIGDETDRSKDSIRAGHVRVARRHHTLEATSMAFPPATTSAAFRCKPTHTRQQLPGPCAGSSQMLQG